jgi:hypothetical protein
MMQPMKASNLEPGILPIFKILVGYWMVYWLTISLILWLTTGQPGTLAAEQYATSEQLACFLCCNKDCSRYESRN